MKIIDFETVRKICSDGNISPSDYHDWVDEVFHHKTDYLMPVKTKMAQKDGNYYNVMPCLNEARNLAMVKMIGRHLLKEGEQRPAMMSDLLLYESDSGILKAVMDGEYITTLRTGASAAHAAILYGKANFTSVGLIGLGNIMTVCVEVLLSKVKDRMLTLKLHKYNGHEKRFYERFKENKNIRFVFCDTYEETVKGSDIIISAATSVTENFCSDECYEEGCTVIPILTMGFQNCDLFFDQVFSDDLNQIKGFKYFDSFKSVKNTSDVLNGNVSGRNNDSERILVYNYGVAVLDLFFAEKVYAMSKNEGKVIDYGYCKEKFFI